MIPPLCDDRLSIHEGRVETLPGVLWVHYWRYTYTPPSSSSSSKGNTTTTSSASSNSSNSNNNKKHPLIVVNGGPGLPHNYVRSLRSLACDGREVVFYDQGGTGASRVHPTKERMNDDDDDDDDDTDDDPNRNMPPELFHIEYYAETELNALIAELGYASFHLLGSSWGTQVVLQYAVSSMRHHHHHQQQQQGSSGLQSLILNAPIADNRRFIEYQWDPVDGSIGRLPLYLQERLRALNRTTPDFQNTLEYQAIANVIMSSFNARLGIRIDCWTETEAAGMFPGDLTPLTGPTDFVWTGDANDAAASLTDWTVLPELHVVTVPVQLNYGEYDFVSPHLVADTAAELSMVECHWVPRAGHSLMLDSPEFVYPKMRDFLMRVEEFTGNNRGRAFRTDPEGVCPVYAHHGITTATVVVAATTTTTHFGGSSATTVVEASILMGLLLLLLFAFTIGFCVGQRHSMKQRDTRGYEMVGETKLYNGNEDT